MSLVPFRSVPFRSVPCEPTGSSVSTPGFTPDSRSHPISLHHTRTDRFTQCFNANVAYGLTPSHSIVICTDHPFKEGSPEGTRADLLHDLQ